MILRILAMSTEDLSGGLGQKVDPLVYSPFSPPLDSSTLRTRIRPKWAFLWRCS